MPISLCRLEAFYREDFVIFVVMLLSIMTIMVMIATIY